MERPIILSAAAVQKILNNETSGFIRPDKGRPYEMSDILWVREPWVLMNVTPEGQIGKLNYYYMADVPDRRPEGWKCHWKSSIHMPREGARLFLRPVDIRHKRLRDITTEELAICGYNIPQEDIRQKFGIDIWNKSLSTGDYRTYRWQANPLVYIIQFERITDLVHVKGNYYIPR